MSNAVTPFPKERQLGKKPKKAEPAPVAEPTVMSEAKERVDAKRAARVAAAEAPAAPVDVHELALTAISHGRNPREHEATTDKSLVESVKQHGILQPIRVRPTGAGQFTIVAGHRRFEAAKVAKLPTIPVVVTMVDEQTAYVQALVENLQREDLNPLDEATGFQALLNETRKTQEEVGRLVGKSQPYVANALRLLTLEPEVRSAVESGKIGVSHAKALVALEPERQKHLAARVESEHLTSKEVEEAVRTERENQKAEQARTELRNAQAAKARTMAAKLLEANPGLTKETLTIWCVAPHLVEALTKDGYRVKSSGHADLEPAWKCACRDTNVEYEDWRGFRTVCVDEAHAKAYHKAREIERKKATEVATKKTDKARSAMIGHLKSADGMTLDGQRVALYLALTSTRGWGSNGGTDAFVKRHGGAPRSSYSDDYGDVWEVCQGMTAADVAAEFAALAVPKVMPNVWADNPDRPERDWKLREYLAEQQVIEKEAVFGPKGMTDAVKKSEATRAERAKVAAEEAKAKESAKAKAKAPKPEPAPEAAREATAPVH